MTYTRPPIIAVVGHIDHGKSALQRALRKMDTQITEAGDITQHIGAYELHADYNGAERKATIIDTPGHEAFSHIREHGIELADLVLLVISSEEGWKEQTEEAYTLIQKTKIPYIVVFTKIDTERSDIEHAKQTVLQQGVFLEKLGGSVPWVAVSSVTNEGIEELIELLFLTTDVYEIIEDNDDGSVGIVVEADIDRRAGIAGTVIVLRNTLEQGGYVHVNTTVAPLRILKDDWGRNITSAVPSMPIRIIGFDAIPPIGEPVFLHATKKEALDAAALSKKTMRRTKTVFETEYGIPVVIRADTASGLLSIQRTLSTAASEGIPFKIIKQGVGEITEEDVRFALAEETSEVIGFHTTVNQRAQHLSERNGGIIRSFSTIYEMTSWAKTVSKKWKEIHEVSQRTGSGIVIRIFSEQPAQKTYIIGIQITDGQFTKGQPVAILRNNVRIGHFTVTSIEQHNTQHEEISGKKSQFAACVTGEGSLALNDTVLALPTHIS